MFGSIILIKSLSPSNVIKYVKHLFDATGIPLSCNPLKLRICFCCGCFVSKVLRLALKKHVKMILRKPRSNTICCNEKLLLCLLKRMGKPRTPQNTRRFTKRYEYEKSYLPQKNRLLAATHNTSIMANIKYAPNTIAE